MATTEPPQSRSEYRVSKITPHNKALAEAGKKMLIDSIDVGREFCKSMIMISTGAIPIYIALLKLVGVENASRSYGRGTILFILPCALFLSATVAYIIGYFPRTGKFSLDVVEEINSARQTLILRRKQMIILATCLFITGILAGMLILVLEALGDH
jgi:hypothetical protein